MKTTLFYIIDPMIEMRENPSSLSKVISQAIFSEKIKIAKEEAGWSYIFTSDGYSGWIPSHAFVALEKPYEPSLQVSRLTAHLYHSKDIEYGPIKTLPYGSQLQALETTDVRWVKVALPNGKECYIQKGDVTPESARRNKSDLAAFSQRFLGLPYTWGGRSSFGYDCSGFIQMLYQQMGLLLPRDSKQQVLDPRFHPIMLHRLEPGDLIFFGKSNQQIMHVGMSLDKGQFIHATSRENQPWLRISHLSDFEWSGHRNAYYSCRLMHQLS